MYLASPSIPTSAGVSTSICTCPCSTSSSPQLNSGVNQLTSNNAKLNSGASTLKSNSNRVDDIEKYPAEQRTLAKAEPGKGAKLSGNVELKDVSGVSDAEADLETKTARIFLERPVADTALMDAVRAKGFEPVQIS